VNGTFLHTELAVFFTNAALLESSIHPEEQKSQPVNQSILISFVSSSYY
jgi:hypothetical protein